MRWYNVAGETIQGWTKYAHYKAKSPKHARERYARENPGANLDSLRVKISTKYHPLIRFRVTYCGPDYTHFWVTDAIRYGLAEQLVRHFGVLNIQVRDKGYGSWKTISAEKFLSYHT